MPSFDPMDYAIPETEHERETRLDWETKQKSITPLWDRLLRSPVYLRSVDTGPLECNWEDTIDAQILSGRR